MPFVALNLSEKLSDSQKEKIKSEIGRLIAVIPGKSEAVTMVDISDGRRMYMGGRQIPCAYVDVRAYTKAEPAGKKRFIEETAAMLEREAGIPKDNIYLSVLEYDEWGDHGVYR